MLGRADGDELVFHERDDLDLAGLLREGDEAEVHGVGDDVFVDEVRAAVFDAHVDVRELLHERLHVRREFVQADGDDGRDVDGAADDLAHLLHLAADLFVAVEDVLGGLVEAPALARQPELLLAAVDDQDVEVLLHRAQLLADGRLGDGVELGGFGEAFVVHQVAEDLQVLDVHGRIVRMINKTNGEGLQV